jgi:hypothetical protein
VGYERLRTSIRALCPCPLSVGASWDSAAPSFQALVGPDGEARLIA